METNTPNREAMLDVISKINAVDGFDPSAFVEEYEGLDGKPIAGIPVAVQEAWFRLKYPEGRIAVHTELGANKDSIVAHARIYKHYTDPDECFLAEASAARSYSEKAPKVLVLKDPKSESSVRKVWLPKTLAYILREWRKSQGKLREMLGEEYVDYDLVITQPNGRPCENKLIEEAFNKLKATAGLPNVVFHSLRSSSTTYKLKLNHGDIKATQGDTGHAQADMVTEVYAQILDEDRKVNAQKFESMFYANPDLRNVTPPPEPTGRFDLAGLIDQLQRSPELASALARIISMPADVGESSY